MGAAGSWGHFECGEVLGCELARVWPRLRHGRRRDALGLEEGGDYTAQTSKGEVGIEGEAHEECSGGLGELEEATERAHGRRRSRRTEVEEDGDGGAAVRPGLLDLAERSGMMWRSAWTGRGSEGEAVDTATTSGGDGSAQLWERERERARQGESESVKGVQGVAWHRRGSPGRRGGSQAGSCRRGTPRRRGCLLLCLLAGGRRRPCPRWAGQVAGLPGGWA